MLWVKLKDKLGRCFPVPGIMQKVRRWLVESEERKQQKRKLPSPQMALLAIVEAIVDGLVFSQDEDVVAQWTSMLFLSSLSQRWTGF